MDFLLIDADGAVAVVGATAIPYTTDRAAFLAAFDAILGVDAADLDAAVAAADALAAAEA